MSKFTRLTSIVLFIIAVSAFTGCGSGDNKQQPSQPTTYSVSFNGNGGSPTPATQSRQSGQTVSEPTAPTRNGYDFGGWYTDNNTFANKVTFPYTVTQTITLFAKWTPSLIEVIENPSGIDEFVPKSGTEQKSILTFIAESAWDASVSVSNPVNNSAAMHIANVTIMDNPNDGCDVSPKSGTAGENTITVSCNINSSNNDRAIEVAISAAVGQVVVPVTQKPVSKGSFTTVDAPGASATMLLRINNNGQILGNVPNLSSIQSFLYDNGKFDKIIFTGKEYLTGAEGLNNSGQIAGNIYEISGWMRMAVGGFLKDGDSYSEIDGPLNAISYMVLDINDPGQVVGHFTDSDGTHGFLYDRAKNSFTVIDHPDAVSTQAYGINNSGSIVGQYTDSDGKDHGFLKSGNSYTTIDHPDARGGDTFTGGTLITGINNSGQIVGAYVDSNYKARGFMKSGGRFIEFDHENAINNAQGTRAYGINNSGQIVGFFGDATFGGLLRGFVLEGLK